MPYKRPKLSNDWGSEKLHVGKTLVDRPCSAKVMWPDGTITVERVKMRQYAITINDMGHDYEAWSLVPYVTTSVRGLSVRVDLRYLRVDEQSIQWEK